MFYQVLFSIVCLLLAGVAKAFLDQSAEGHFFKKTWYNKDSSFRNKWAVDGNGERILYSGPRLWYHLWAFTPKYVERFWWSSNVLVFITDGWHLFQCIMLFFICLAPAGIAFPKGWLMLVIFLSGALVLKGYFVIIRRFVLKNKT